MKNLLLERRSIFFNQHYNKMKNIELYRTIEALVENKKLSCKPGKPSFAHEYCKQQIQKKKLIPFNPKSKMNRLMKNFQRIDTYVNMEELFQYIKVLITEKQKGDPREHKNITWKGKNNIVSNDEFQIILKARQKLGSYIQKIYLKQNQEIWNLISELENQSNVGSYRKQNCPSYDDLSFYIKNMKENQNEDIKYSNQKQPSWRFYEGNNYVFEDLTEKNKAPQIDKLILQPTLKKRQEKTQLIHQVATYLQIILQNYHKKKWAQRNIEANQYEKQNGKSHSVKPFRCSLRMKKDKHTMDCRSTGQKFHVSKISTQKSETSNSMFVMRNQGSVNSSVRGSPKNSFIIKKGVKENFTFRNRNIKQGLMKKIDSFLDFVETQQKQYKKEKNSTLNQIMLLENKSKIEYDRYFQKGLAVEDNEIKKIQNIVHLQK